MNMNLRWGTYRSFLIKKSRIGRARIHATLVVAVCVECIATPVFKQVASRVLGARCAVYRRVLCIKIKIQTQIVAVLTVQQVAAFRALLDACKVVRHCVAHIVRLVFANVRDAIVTRCTCYVVLNRADQSRSAGSRTIRRAFVSVHILVISVKQCGRTACRYRKSVCVEAARSQRRFRYCNWKKNKFPQSHSVQLQYAQSRLYNEQHRGSNPNF